MHSLPYTIIESNSSKISVAMKPEITEKDCHQILEQHTGGNNFHILSYEIYKASSKVMGYLGEHFRLKIHFQKDLRSKIETGYFFLKSEPLSNITQANYVEELGLFKKESLLYKNILSKLTAIAGTYFSPKCYLVKKNCLVFEDLSQKNYKVKESYLDLHECESMLKCLAVFHSASIIYEELKSKEGKKFRIDQTYTEEIREVAFSFVEGQPRNMWLKNMVKCVSDCINYKLKLKDANNVTEKLRKLAFNDIKRYICASSTYRNVVTHCDLWNHNFMMNEENECKLIDFQLARYCPPAYDIMLTLILNTKKSMIQKHLERFLNLYYDIFENMLSRYQLSAEEIFPKKTFLESVQYFKMATYLEATFFSTTTMISPETSNYIVGDAQRYREFTFTDRSKFIMEEYDKNETFRKGFLELLMPLIELLRDMN